MSWQFDIVVMACAVPMFYLATRPEELRRHRWLRILGSLPLVFGVCTFFLPFFIGGLGLLAFIWGDVISYYVGGKLIDFLHSDTGTETGNKPDYHYARNHRRDGERDKAIAAIRHELTKDAKNFEGNLLLAEIYEDLNKPDEAIKYLDIIIDNSSATPDQIAMARNEKENCRQLRRHLDEAKFFKHQT